MTLPELHPYDSHNRRLEAAVRPLDWSNPTPEGPYNLLVIGAGTAGLVSAAIAAGLGAKVALVERNAMGGDCLNVGCVPSKALISAARAAAETRRAGEFGVRAGQDTEVDFAAVMERLRRLRADISPADSAARFRDEKGVDVYFGQAAFTGRTTVDVEGASLKFKRCVIATGTRAAAPPVPGLPDVDYLTNESVFSLTELPPSLAVIGAGPIGCELSQAFSRLGSRVSLIEANHGVLPRDDREAAGVVAGSLSRDGVQLLCCGEDLRVAPAEGGRVRVSLHSHGDSHDLTVDRLLVAAGREPNVEGMGLDRAGVEHDRHGVRVDDRLRTTNRCVYAAGDVCSRYKFTHAADFMARAVVRNALFMGRAKASALVIPWATYTSPELAHVGLSEREAADRGVAIDTYREDFSDVDRAVLDGETEGFVKVHTRRGSDKIVGATIVGRHAADMIGAVSIAMTNKVGLGGIAESIFPYPSQAEAIRKAGDQYSRTRLTPAVAAFLRTWLRWTR